MEPMKYKKGDVVDFIGKVHYTRPTGKVYFSVHPGVARILAIIPEAAHPFYLKGVSSSVDGWVNSDTIKGIHQDEKEIEIVSYAKSKIVKIASIQNTNPGIEIISEPWKDKNWTVVYRLKNATDAEKVAHMAEVGCTKQRFSLVKNMVLEPSTMAETCLFAAKIPVESTNKKEIIASGLFYIFDSDYYLTQFRYLRRGDILIGPDTSAIVLSNGPASAEQKLPINVKHVKDPVDVRPAKRIKAAFKK